eukprot:229922-Rhodomonas_salina.1
MAAVSLYSSTPKLCCSAQKPANLPRDQLVPPTFSVDLYHSTPKVTTRSQLPVLVYPETLLLCPKNQLIYLVIS